ncbi:hypothetical protein DNTS_030869 [Danionella cerebrum]|uniref:Uncharacterized protein n=1 Tax=Danionella cerebrum TaxID=2873325 RepID=A0A553RMW3_9TELE|nr:hypothetical protein DNTS_030869 [Danionella translucida]
MLSRLQELKKEEETLLKIKFMLQDQLNRLKASFQTIIIMYTLLHSFQKFEEGTLKSMINAQSKDIANDAPATESAKEEINPDDETGINQTKLVLGAQIDYGMEEEEEEEDEEENEEDYDDADIIIAEDDDDY